MSYDPHAAIIEQRIQREVASRMQAVRLEFAAELEQRAQTIRDEVRAEYEHRLREANDTAARWREQAGRTHAEWLRDQQEAEQRNRAAMKANDARPKRKGKQLNRVEFDLKATISPDAEATFAAMVERYGPRAGKSFVVTHGQAVGTDLWVRITYTVTGGEKADVRRNLARCLRDAGAELVGDEVIEVLSRDVLEDDLTG